MENAYMIVDEQGRSLIDQALLAIPPLPGHLIEFETRRLLVIDAPVRHVLRHNGVTSRWYATVTVREDQAW